MAKPEAGDRLSQMRASILVATTPHSRIDEAARALLGQSVPIGDSELVIANGLRTRAIARRLARTRELLGERMPLRILGASRSTRTHALNTAAGAARNELLILLADDFVPDRSWLEAHLRLHASRPEANVCGVGPARFGESLRRSAFRRWLEDSGLLFGAPLAEPGARPPRDFFYGANTSLKRLLFRAAGGFDEAFRHDTKDDGELGLRLRDLGAEVVYLATAGAVHDHPLTLVGRCVQMLNTGQSAAILELRHPSVAPLRSRREALGPAVADRASRVAGPRSLWRQTRERLWQELLSACFASAYRWTRRALARAGGAGALPPPPRPSPEEVLAVECVGGGGSNREWVACGSTAQARGLEVLHVFDGRCASDGAGGAESMAFFNPDGPAQAYFRLTRPHDLDGRGVEVAVEVLADSAHDALHIEYDSTDEVVHVAGMAPGAFKSTSVTPLPRSGEWTQVRFVIEDPRFCPSINGADFRVVSRRSHGIPLRLRRVKVSIPSRAAEVRKRRVSGLSFPAVASPVVSIIVPTLDRLEMLRDCLCAIRVHSDGPYEVIVVDDASSDGTSRALGEVSGLRLVTLPTNRGFARACNAGAAAARAKELLFLNNDTLPLQGWLGPMLQALERDPLVAVVGSRLLYPRVGRIQHAGIELSDDGPIHRLRFQPADAPEAQIDRRVPAVTGACMLVRGEVFSRLGGFAEAFRNGYEDIDLCLRARELGFEVLYCASSILLHHESASPGRFDPERERLNRGVFEQRWRALLHGSRAAAKAGGRSQQVE